MKQSNNEIIPVCAITSTYASCVKEEMFSLFAVPSDILENLNLRFELSVFKRKELFSAALIIETEEGKVIDVENLIFKQDNLNEFYSFIKLPFSFLSNPEINILWFTERCEITTQEFRDTIRKWKLSCIQTNDSSN